VRAALTREYGGDIDVIPSVWPERIFRDIEAAVADSGVARGLTREITDAGQMRVAATFLHLPSQLAYALRAIAERAVACDAW
jgi:hypothetical protein